MMKRPFTTAATVAVVMVSFTANAQSLGDVARQTEAKRSTGKKATKAYTNADLGEDGVPAPPPSPAAEPQTSSGFVSKSTGEALTAEEMVAASKEKLATANTNMDEKWWRSEASRLRNEVDRMRVLVSEFRSSTPRTAGMKAVAAKELAKAEGVLAGAEKRWAAFEQSAHHSQVPKAWLEP